MQDVRRRPPRIAQGSRRRGSREALWHDVPKSSKAPKAVRSAIKAGADLIFVSGGDDMVQRSIDTIVEGAHAVPIAILPAGTGNLLANNLEIPPDIEGAVGARAAGRPSTAFMSEPILDAPRAGR